jgi:uncharacterized protein YifE (UPF0438 family)
MEKITSDAKKRERSVSYPAIPLEEAITLSFELRKALGRGPYSREDAAVALGYKGVSGTSATKIATMTHFGLLTRHGNAYSQSELADRINHPVSEEDRTMAIRESVRTPKLYQDLLEQYLGQALPTHLANILMRKGVGAGVAEDVANNFRISSEFAGLLKNGVVTETPGDSDLSNMAKDANQSNLPSVVQQTKITDAKKYPYLFNDSGDGWELTIKSGRPLTSTVKKKLVDIS